MENYEQLLTMVGLSAAVGLLVIALISAVLHFFVGLNAPPKARAFWTVAPAYALCVFFGAIPADSPFPIWVWPVGALLPAAIWYWFWMRDFEKRWYQDVEQLPDDVPLANHDWKNGLLQLALFLLIGLVVAGIRTILRG
ncbi:MAG: hypothetical protein Q7T60_06215 [Sphingopyxis sp.]|nr:hypothetical protein [Sphingopyxis sp.]